MRRRCAPPLPPALRDATRRRLLLGAAGLAVAGPSAALDTLYDVARIEPLEVERSARPTDTAMVQQLLRDWPGRVSIGGGRYSMGGQIAAPGTLHLDMRAMRRVLRFDPVARRIRVQAGATWRDLQSLIDPHELSIAVMQSYSNFTLGGSVSVNCHGRYVGRGPLAGSVRALRLVRADGSQSELSPEREPEVFAAVLGGYGVLGVVTEVELELDRNQPIERHVERVALDEYPHWFAQRVLADPRAVLHNADLTPPDFSRPFAVTWYRSERRVTEPARLVPRDADYRDRRWQLWAASELGGGDWLRAKHQQRQLEAARLVVWRNFEASLDVASLEPASRLFSTWLLQEYFVPVAEFQRFARRMAAILRKAGVAAFNVSIRHATADRVALLRWAPEDVFCFVLYHKQATHAGAEAQSARWSRALVEAALDCGGRHYLPYRLHATASQVHLGYPQLDTLARLKQRVDPANRFDNLLWRRYVREA